ncbi:MAG TPA: ACP S-malonyltransferase [Paenalcaligenes sp.]|nr:ACP S-malonyltransferase [Paenalcaligenes sp.]
MKLAFVFPGQGSQSVGMLDAWLEQPGVSDLLDEANRALDEDLSEIIAQGPTDSLNLTVNTQPAMLLSAVLMYRQWVQAGGMQPEIMAGHSLGEYSALTAAGALTLPDALRLVRIRATAMQDAVPVGQGAMAAVIGLDDETIEAVCANCSSDTQIVQAVNYNAPGQVVIAGHREAVEQACEHAKEKGARRALVLPVSAPFHSRLLEPAAQVLQAALADISLGQPQVTVINNVDVKSPDDPAQIKDALVRQAWHPVRWVETIEAMQARGVTHIVECGPGRVLSGLVRRIDRNLTALSFSDPDSMHTVLEKLKA